MLYPPIADLLSKVGSSYLLVNVVAKRAREIADEANEKHLTLEDKPVTMAIHEVYEDKLDAELKQEYMK